MGEIPAGTTTPRGFPPSNQIAWPLRPARNLFELKYGRALIASSRRAGDVTVYGTNGPCGEHDTKLFDGPGVILGRKGQGPLGVEWSESDYWVIDTAYSLTLLTDAVDLKFAYYLISYIGLNHLKDGTSNPSLSREVFGAQALPIPPIDVQRQIISLLSALDDKIELNRRMNETLEAMARVIFKDWFVDFGPTRTKMAGRAPYLAPEIWDLFPDALDDEDKPVGWEEEPVHAQAHWVNGAAYKNMHFTDTPDALPVIKIAELKAGVTNNTKFTNTELGEKYRITDGEMLFSWSGNPDTSIDIFIWTGGDAWLNQHIFAVRENEKRSLAFLYAMLKWLKPEFSEIARNKQTTGLGHVTQQDLKRLLVHIGSTEVMVAFDDLIQPIYDRIFGNLMEMRSLAQTRDLLLPKLMSGEIRLADAEKAVEAVA